MNRILKGQAEMADFARVSARTIRRWWPRMVKSKVGWKGWERREGGPTREICKADAERLVEFMRENGV